MFIWSGAVKVATDDSKAELGRLITEYSKERDLFLISGGIDDGGRLRGYRVSAGKDRKQFESLGFKPNDIVTGVNGIELTDPGKAMELYRIMRSAEEASFNVERDGEELTLVVGLKNSSVSSTEDSR